MASVKGRGDDSRLNEILTHTTIATCFGDIHTTVLKQYRWPATPIINRNDLDRYHQPVWHPAKASKVNLIRFESRKAWNEDEAVV